MSIYISSSGTLSAEELERFSRNIAAFLAENGIHLAAVVTGKSPLVCSAVKACCMAHVCCIPVDESLPSARAARIIADAEILLYDGVCPFDFPNKADLSGIAAADRSFTPAEEDNSAPAYRIYTSGTTGAPKGIEVTCGNLNSFMEWFSTIPAIAETAPRSVLNQAQFSFDLSVADLWYSLLNGLKLTVIERSLFSDMSGMFRRMADSAAELAVLTPSFAELCLCDSGFSPEILPELKVMFFCGEVLRPATAAKLFSRFPGVRIVNAYGPAECCCAVTAVEITPEMTSSALPVGELSHTAGSVFVEKGEIVITGKSAARYTSDCGGFGEFQGERCFFTGDLGYIRDNKLYFIGRRDRQLKIMGFRIEPEEIENALLKIPGVNQAVVQPMKFGRHTGLAAAVCADGIATGEIRAALSEMVPEYMLPRRISIVGELPLNRSGKLDRKG